MTDSTFLLIYGLVAFVSLCTVYELRVEIERRIGADGSPGIPIVASLLWPFTLALAAMWLASWTVRGPIRMTRRMLRARRQRLPRAEIRQTTLERKS